MHISPCTSMTCEHLSCTSYMYVPTAWYKCQDELPLPLECFSFRMHSCNIRALQTFTACTCAASSHYIGSIDFLQYASYIVYWAIIFHCDRLSRSGLCWKCSSCLVSLEAFQRPHFRSLLEVLAHQKSFTTESLSRRGRGLR